MNQYAEMKQDLPVSGKLADTRLRMAAIRALPQQIEVEVTLTEALQGTSRDLQINDNNCCNDCVNLKPINRLQCQSCKGVGYVQSKRHVEVPLSGGLAPGQTVVYKGLGRYDFRSGQHSDLIIRIKITDDSDLKAVGKDVTCAVEIPFEINW